MFDLVNNFIEIYGNPKLLVAEVERLQQAFIQNTKPLDRTDLLALIYGGPAAVPPPAKNEHWPRWVEPEFHAPQYLTLISQSHAVSEVQNHLTRHLSTLDSRVITLMEWNRWPQECGARIAYLHKQQLFSIKKESSRNEGILRDVYCTRSGDVEVDEDEADTAYLWDEIGHCTEYVKAMAMRSCSRIRKSSFSKNPFLKAESVNLNAGK